MNKKQVLEKARKVLRNNKGYQEAVESYKETATRLTHWGEPETVEELIFQWEDGTVILSNEGSVRLTHYNYNLELIYGLREEFEKAKLFVEPYDGGTFHITEDN